MITIDLKRPITLETALTRLARGLYVGHADSGSVFKALLSDLFFTVYRRTRQNQLEWREADGIPSHGFFCAEEVPGDATETVRVAPHRELPLSVAYALLEQDPDKRAWGTYYKDGAEFEFRVFEKALQIRFGALWCDVPRGAINGGCAAPSSLFMDPPLRE